MYPGPIVMDLETHQPFLQSGRGEVHAINKNKTKITPITSTAIVSEHYNLSKYIYILETVADLK